MYRQFLPTLLLCTWLFCGWPVPAVWAADGTPPDPAPDSAMEGQLSLLERELTFLERGFRASGESEAQDYLVRRRARLLRALRSVAGEARRGDELDRRRHRELWRLANELGEEPAKEARESAPSKAIAFLGGTVRDEEGATVPGVRLEIYASTGHHVANAHTNSLGFYSAELEAGTYTVRTSLFEFDPWVQTIHGGELCQFRCDPALGSFVTLADGETRDDIDLVLREGASISGTVVLSDGEPAMDAEVKVYDSEDRLVRFVYADLDGTYLARGLLGGEHRVRFDYPGARDELWLDRPCDGECVLSQGDLLSLTLGGRTAGIDAELQILGKISVTAVDSVSGEAIPFFEIEVFNQDGLFLTSNFGGELEVGGLEGGLYFVELGAFDHMDQLWQGQPCEFGCDVTSGTPVQVVEGGTSELQAELVPYGGFAGRVTDERTGDGLADVWVQLFTADGLWGGVAYSGSTGDYSAERAPVGALRLVAESFDGYRIEAWDDHLCTGIVDCYQFGDPVAIAPAETTAGLDFELTAFSRIGGRVSAEGSNQPLGGALVEVFRTDGSPAGADFANVDGRYLVGGLVPGTYVVKADVDSYEGQLFDGLPCESSCDVLAGTPVVLGEAQEISNIDFSLAKSPFIYGRVTDEATGESAVHELVEYYDGVGEFRGSALVREDGSYEIDNLEQVNYFLVAGGRSYIPVLFGGGTCPGGVEAGGCDPLDGTPIAATGVGAEVDIELPLGGGIRGRVETMDDATLPSGGIAVFDLEGRRVAEGRFVDFDASYVAGGLETGRYYALTDLSRAFEDVLWPSIPCDRWPAQTPCDVSQGTPIDVVRGETTDGIDFTVDRAGAISGVVRDRSGLPILGSSGGIRLHDADGLEVDYEPLFNSGGAFTIDGVIPGTYFLRTDFKHLIDRVYGGEACEPLPCDPTSGTPITVNNGQTSGPFEIELAPGPGFAVTVLSSRRRPLEGVTLRARGPSGFWVAVAETDRTGRALIGLPSGEYYFSTENDLGFVDEVWPDLPCAGPCDLVGTPIIIEPGSSSLSRIHFVLDPM